MTQISMVDVGSVILKKLKQDDEMLITIIGRRCGMSYAAMRICEFYNQKPFTAEDVIFTPEEFIERIRTFKVNDNKIVAGDSKWQKRNIRRNKYCKLLNEELK